jgi:hypothetical protein
MSVSTFIELVAGQKNKGRMADFSSVLKNQACSGKVGALTKIKASVMLKSVKC